MILNIHFKQNFHNFIKPFNDIAQEFGAKPFTGFLDLMMTDLTLVTDTPEMLGISRERMESWKPVNPGLYSRKPMLIYVWGIYARRFRQLTDDGKKFLTSKKAKVSVALTSSKKEYIKAVYSAILEMDVNALI